MAKIIINGNIYEMKCSSTDCENNLHFFRPSKSLEKQGFKRGCCQNCKTSLIDWDRLHMRNIDDIEYTQSAFKLEYIRNVFWTLKKPTEKMVERYRDVPLDQFESKVKSRLETTLSLPHSKNIYDGRQTKTDDDNIIHWAQHATGTCCRVCLEEWYGIDREQANITINEYEYLTKIVMRYISVKLKDNNEI